VRHSSTPSKLRASAFDLHVLSTQPAFVLSQDQTLHKKIMLQNESQQDSQPDHGGDRSWPNKSYHQQNKQFLASQLVQTNTLLDSQTTNTHPSPQPTQGHVHWGHPHQISPPHNPTPDRTRVRPGQTRQKPCSSNHVPGGATRYNSRP